jgi:Zn-dependent protease with chaperone function
MNFFEHQAHARERTRVLLLVFGMAVVAVVATVSYFMTRASLVFDLFELFTSPVPLLVTAMLVAVVFEEKVGRTLASTVTLAVLAAAVLFVLPGISRYQGVSWRFYLWNAYDFALAPQTLLMWALLVWIFIRDRASLRRNALLALALLPAAMVLRFALNLTFIVGHQMTQPYGLVAVLLTSLVPLAIIGRAATHKARELRGGGQAVASALGATLLEDGASDPSARQLRNVVEEMAIAASLPPPEIYVIEQPGINALVAGWTPATSVIIVTRGAIEQLSRDELQGLVAHEFSHILNGDIRLDIRLIALMHGLTAISALGRRIMRGVVETPYPIMIPGMVLAATVMSAGFLGTLLADMIRAAVSHSRQYLADASAVQFTRQPEGLLNTLKKIREDVHGPELEVDDAGSVAHMLFTGGGGRFLFSTHPPVELRILALDPAGLDTPAARPITAKSVAAEAVAPEKPAAVAGGAPVVASAAAVAAFSVVAKAGLLTPSSIRAATHVHAALPTAVADLARHPEWSPVLIYGLLLEEDVAAKAAQVRRIHADWGATVAGHVVKLEATIRAIPTPQRFPLLLMGLRALQRRRPPDELRKIRDTVHALIHADGHVRVFEYALGALVEAHLNEVLQPAAASALRLTAEAVPDEIATVLAVFAQVGHADEAEAERAFQRGLEQIQPAAGRAYRKPGQWHSELDAALDRLDHLVPFGKKKLLDALTETILHDGLISNDEYELLRAVCTRLHVPLPQRAQGGPAAAPTTGAAVPGPLVPAAQGI